MNLHNLRLDPLWKQAPKGKRQKARAAAYQIISESLGLAGRDTHTGMFTIEQCRQAWTALDGLTTERLLER
jgi:hypothetical protein